MLTTLFPTLSRGEQSNLWTAAHAPDNNLPYFTTTNQIESFWRALHSALTLSTRYPGAGAASPILKAILPRL